MTGRTDGGAHAAWFWTNPENGAKLPCLQKVLAAITPVSVTASPKRWSVLCGAVLAMVAGFPLAAGAAYQLPPASGVRTDFINDDDFLDYVQHKTFNFFWDTQNPVTGLMLDRASNPGLCSIASLGFGLSSINVGVDHGWITRAEGRTRVRTALQFLWNLPQGSGTTGIAGYHGWFYHFLDTTTGLRVGTCELSTIDTTLLMLGVLDCGLFFNDPADADEAAIRQLSTNLINRIDWAFVTRSDNRIAMDWDPVAGFRYGGWSGYSEAMALYLLGLGAQTNPLPAPAWTAWTSTYLWKTHYGYGYVWTPTGSLFTHCYSHCWVDFRGINDPYLRTNGGGIDYFENSRRATLAQQAYAATQPFPNYGTFEFGVTACDGPNATVGGVFYTGYTGRGAPPGPPTTIDDGTLAPTAALGALPFAPEACLPVARHLYATYLPRIWSDYGFCDAFNIQAGEWFDPDVVGIDAGPIILMIENYRHGSLWRRLLHSPIIQRGLERAAFTAPPPESPEATAVSGTQLDVTWVDRSDFETGFQVEISTDGTNFFTAATVSAGITHASLTVHPGTGYYVRVRTTSSAGLSGALGVAFAATPAPVVITAQPGSLVVTNGQTAVFTVGASGNGGLAYQWFKGNAAIAGATGATLTLANVQSTDAGDYSVVVTNAAGSTASQTVTLTVPPLFFPHPTCIVADPAGNLYIGDSATQTVQQVNSTSQVALLAGMANTAGSTDGSGSTARFNKPGGIAVAGDGTITLADTANGTIRRITASGLVTTLAGSTTNRGNNDGVGSSATFSSPRGLALSPAGTVFVADAMNHTIRRIALNAVVDTFAGTAGVMGAADGTGSAGRFNFPTGVALDPAGVLYVVDTTNNTIRRITPSGVVTTLAGLAGVSGLDDGSGPDALFNHPGGLAVDVAGYIYVADTGNSAIRRITPAGTVTTIAGLPGIAGLQDGHGPAAYFNQPQAITAGSGGNLYVADTGNGAIRRITPAGEVTTLVLSTAPSPPPPGNGGGGVTPPPSGGSGGGGGDCQSWFSGALSALLLLRYLRPPRIQRAGDY
jgi:hypothetical protein